MEIEGGGSLASRKPKIVESFMGISTFNLYLYI